MSNISDVHLKFDETEALRLIQNRYQRSAKMFYYTLRQLAEDKAFQELLAKLRDAGWKDWLVLLAVGNIRLNSLVDARDPDYKELMQSAMRRGEGQDDALAPPTLFNEERLRSALQMSHLSTITSMGFRVEQMTPNFPGIDAFLRRLKYWDLDVPHSDPFQPAE